MAKVPRFSAWLWVFSVLRTLRLDAAQDHRGRMAPSEPLLTEHARVFLLFSANHLIANDLAKLEQDTTSEGHQLAQLGGRYG